jgi:hypothetical protein
VVGTFSIVNGYCFLFFGVASFAYEWPNLNFYSSPDCSGPASGVPINAAGCILHPTNPNNTISISDDEIKEGSYEQFLLVGSEASRSRGGMFNVGVVASLMIVLFQLLKN